MARLVWDEDTKRYFETGVEMGVLYVRSDPNEQGEYEHGPYGDGTTQSTNCGVAWNGLTNVSEAPSGASATTLWADDIKYANIVGNEEFGGTIEAYQYPKEFAECDGSAQIVPGMYAGEQRRKVFGFAFKSIIGNDTDGLEHGYKLHLIYNAVAQPSEKGYPTVTDSPDAISMSWTFTTTPAVVTGFKPSAHIVVDSRYVDANKLQNLENALFGSTDSKPYLPMPDQVKQLLSA